MHVLVVEDNRADVFLVREAIARYHLKVELHVVENGKAAFDFIDMADADPSAPCPCLAMLDLNVPIRDGREVLQHLRESRKCSHVPVLIMTSSDSPSDHEATSRLGANAYFRKPLHYDEFLKIGEEIKRLLPAEAVETP